MFAFLYNGNMTCTCKLRVATPSTFHLCYGLCSMFAVFFFLTSYCSFLLKWWCTTSRVEANKKLIKHHRKAKQNYEKIAWTTKHLSGAPAINPNSRTPNFQNSNCQTSHTTIPKSQNSENTEDIRSKKSQTPHTNPKPPKYPNSCIPKTPSTHNPRLPTIIHNTKTSNLVKQKKKWITPNP